MAQAEEWEKAGQDEVAIANWVAGKLKELETDKNSLSASSSAIYYEEVKSLDSAYYDWKKEPPHPAP